VALGAQTVVCVLTRVGEVRRSELSNWHLSTDVWHPFSCSALTDAVHPMMRVSVLEILEMMERLFAVEDPNVLRLGRRQTPDGPAQVHEVWLHRGVKGMHSDLAWEVVRLPRVAGTAGGDDVGPIVRASTGKWNEVIACQ